MDLDSSVDLLVKFLSSSYILRSKPYTNVSIPESRMKSFCKFLILMVITYKTGIKLNGLLGKGPHIGDEIIRHASTTQEAFRNLTFGAVNCIYTYSGRAPMCNTFKSTGATKI